MAPLLVRKNWEKFRLTSVHPKRLLHVFGVRCTVVLEEPKQDSFLGPADPPELSFSKLMAKAHRRKSGCSATDFGVVFPGLHPCLLGDLLLATQILEASRALLIVFPQANVFFGGLENANGQGQGAQGGEGPADVFLALMVVFELVQCFVAQHSSYLPGRFATKHCTTSNTTKRTKKTSAGPSPPWAPGPFAFSNPPNNTFACGNAMSSAGDASTTWVPRRRCPKG